MRTRIFLLTGIAALFFCFIFAVRGQCQYREYYIYGKVVDNENEPLPKVEITLRDKGSSRSYRVTTDKNGDYKLIGIPHGIYEVTVRKEGYQMKTDEWNFETSQDRMQKVEMGAIVLVSEEKIREIERVKQARVDFEQAAEKIRQADFDRAITILKRMIEKNPDDANAHYLLGICYLRKKMFPDAVQELTKTTELQPSFAGAYHQLGIYYQQQRELDKALEFYKKALELEPKSAESLYNAGLILFELNRVPEALTYFEKALELRPSDPEFLEMASRSHIHQQNFARALEYLEKAKNASPDNEKREFLEQMITKLKEQIKK